ncbi:hypothetical protein C5S35_15195 [Candidatus Methanophagaceae archaeon]|nr:hypothetical protein C5S35_15195 [Methanophagales archaeon]
MSSEVIFFLRSYKQLKSLEAVPQLILTTKKSILLGFKALFVFLFLAFLDCWTTFLESKMKNWRL